MKKHRTRTYQKSISGSILNCSAAQRGYIQRPPPQGVRVLRVPVRVLPEEREHLSVRPDEAIGEPQLGADAHRRLSTTAPGLAERVAERVGPRGLQALRHILVEKASSCPRSASQSLRRTSLGLCHMPSIFHHVLIAATKW